MKTNLHKRGIFLDETYTKMRLFFECYGTNYNSRCIKYMKLIANQLLYEFYLLENKRIDALRVAGKLTPKEVVRLKKENRNKFLEHYVKKGGL